MAGLRAGFFLGFVGGAVAASLLGREGLDAGEAPTGVLGEVRGRLREAIVAAREAAQDKERELNREFERATHRGR